MTITTKPESGLAAYHRHRSDEARKKLMMILRQIEIELDERGYYCEPDNPDRHLRLSMAEVQRRASLGDAVLRNKRHHDLRKIVKDWLQKHNARSATSKPAGKKAKRDTIHFYEEALQKTSSEAQAWLIRRAKYEKGIRELKQDIESIRAHGNVVDIGARWP